MTDGSVRRSIALLQPKKTVINPKLNVPMMPPNALIDPNQESSSFVSGPVFNGVSSDNR